MSFWSTYITAEVRLADVNGTRTRIVAMGDAGSGARPLLLLHGRGGHLETFVHNVESLAARGPVVSVDLLGHGLTEQAGDSYSVGELTDHIVSVVEHFDDGRGFDVVGQSLGAWVALRVAERVSARIGKLVLIEPAGLQSEEDRMADPRVRQAFANGGKAFEAPTIDSVRLRFAQLLHDPEACEDEMVELRRLLYSIPGATDVHQAVRRADNTEFLIEPELLATLPSAPLFIRGEHGHIPLDVFEQCLAAVPAAALATVPYAKQWPHYEQPDLVNHHILTHLEN